MLTAEDVRRLVADKLKDMTQVALAESMGVSASYLNDYLHFRREPGPKILEALGLRAVVGYEREAEIDRMRRALHEIAEEWAGAECGEPVHAQEAYAIGLAKRMYALAVEGLTPNVGIEPPRSGRLE